MEYRGYYINDARLYNQIKEEKVIDYFPGDYNEFELGEEELMTLVAKIKEKADELNNQGISFNNLRFTIGGTQWEYNPNGPDIEADRYINLCWEELESIEKYNERLAREKADIDRRIKDDEEAKKFQERITEANKQQSLREAIKLIEQNGGTVKFKRR